MAYEAIYQHPEDNLVASGTLTLDEGTENGEYPIANLESADLYLPAKLTTTSGALMWDFGSSQRVDLVALGAHNFDAGLNVRFQQNSSDSWGSPSVDAAITIPAWQVQGGISRPLRAWVDLTLEGGYSAGGYRYARLVLGDGSPDNSNPIALCRPWIGALKRTLEVNFETPFRRLEHHPAVSSRTAVGVETVYDRLARWRRFSGRVPLWALGQFEAWHQAAGGRALPVLWIPQPDVNDAWWVRFASEDQEIETLATLYHSIPLELEELSPGLPL